MECRIYFRFIITIICAHVYASEFSVPASSRIKWIQPDKCWQSTPREIIIDHIVPYILQHWTPSPESSTYSMLSLLFDVAGQAPDQATTLLENIARNGFLIRFRPNNLIHFTRGYCFKGAAGILFGQALDCKDALIAQQKDVRAHTEECKEFIDKHDMVALLATINAHRLNINHLILFMSNPQVLERLRFHQINISACVKNTDLARIAIMQKNNDLLLYLIQNGIMPRSFHLRTCIDTKNTDAASLLLEHGWDPNGYRDKKGNTNLMLATRRNNITLVCKLIQKGASKTDVNKVGETALRIAQRYHYAHLIPLLKP